MGWETSAAGRSRTAGRSTLELTILQKQDVEPNGTIHTVRCGSTLVIDLDEPRIVYAVRKSLRGDERLQGMLAFLEGQDARKTVAAKKTAPAGTPALAAPIVAPGSPRK